MSLDKKKSVLIDSRQKTVKQRRMNVDVTFMRRCFDVMRLQGRNNLRADLIFNDTQ